MKPLFFISSPALSRFRNSGRRGIALVIVLASLVLLTILVLAFLVSIGSELHSSKVYANGSSVKLLAQSAVDMIIAEIRDATSSTSNPCWVSQPGMIRTFDATGANTGTSTQYYKLYSDSIMTGTGQYDPTTTANAVPSNWYNQKGIYIDLNEPINVNGTNQYPILDGNAADLTTLTGSSGVAGFSVSGAPVNPNSINQSPMPVKWLYVLKGGQVIAPDSNSVSGTVTFTGSSQGPTASNPIVGRMAFWTDDETCKVNINTASEAANTWDIPRLNTRWDKEALSFNQPVQHEFQRFPGHPATVCLSTVFGPWLPVPTLGTGQLTTGTTGAYNGTTGTYTTSNYASQLAPYYALAPRIVAGTGENVSAGPGGATTPAGTGSQAGTSTPVVSNVTTVKALTPDTDRLYNSVDELIFQPTLTGTTTGTRNTNNPAITQQVIEQTKFFLTAHSRAPDVNLFNQPRVSMWPLSVNTGTPPANSSGYTLYRSPIDQLMAFCTTLNQAPYYFQRVDPNSPSTDLPATAPTVTTKDLTRNRALMEYLRYLMKQQIPGFGGDFADKYNSSDTIGNVTGQESDQILTELFDYIRCTNIRDQSMNTSFSGTSTIVKPYTVPLNSSNVGVGGEGSGQVVPIVDSTTNTRGFGRFPTVQQAALIYYICADDQKPTAPNLALPDSSSNPWVYHPTQIRAMLVLSLFDPAMGHPFNVPWFEMDVTGMDSLKWPDGSAMYSHASATVGSWGTVSSTNGGSFFIGSGTGPMTFEPFFGGTIGFRRVMFYDLDPLLGPSGTVLPHSNLSDIEGNQSQFQSNPYPTGTTSPLTALSQLTPPITNIPFAGGSITVNIYNKGPTSSVTNSNSFTRTLLQSVTLNFPPATFPLPQIPSYPPSTQPYETGGSVWAGAAYPPPYSHRPSGSLVNNNYHQGWELWQTRFDSQAVSPNSSATGNFTYSFVEQAHSTTYVNPDVVAIPGQVNSNANYGDAYNEGFNNITSDNDVIQSVIPSPGDMRLIAARQTINSSASGSLFAKHPLYGVNAMAHDLQTASGNPVYMASTAAGGVGGRLVPLSYCEWFSTAPTTGSVTSSTSAVGTTGEEYLNEDWANPLWSDVPTINGAFVGDKTASATSGVAGDWDTGIANFKDGAYINKPDEGDYAKTSTVNYPYYFPFSSEFSEQTFFSASRIIPSPGMFGSLPTGVLANKPWQTLLFRPGPASHPGLGSPVNSTVAPGPPYTTPPDSLIMDLFTMPVVEPYAISEPLSTAGRVNMNYQIFPFTYITRSTALQAALKSIQLISIPDTASKFYKSAFSTAQYNIGSPTNTSNDTTFPNGQPNGANSYRFGLNIASTLTQFAARFASKDVFRAPAEICSIDLVPADDGGDGGSAAPTTISRSTMDAYWATHRLTGDNLRERPYTNLYPLLTTRSNTFTVHFRVQTLQQVTGASAAPTQWREGTDVTTGEYRGSETIERYVDPNDTTIPDYAVTPTTAPAQPLSNFYKFRVVAVKQFAP